jgi:beta-lactamase superfamily II metal-dependent hydrolase
MRSALLALALVLSCGVATIGQRAATANPALNIYVIDVEGGNATLFVSPTGESLLIDTGNAGAGAVRDATRIMEAVRDAGLSKIDYLIITHWHGDHYGGLSELAARIPIAHFIDHGPNVQPAQAADDFLRDTYPKLHAKATHAVAKVGETLGLKGVQVRVVTSAGQVLPSSLPGAGGANPYCANFTPGDNNAEDPQSVGSLITFGRFRAVHFGDLTKNKEFELMCPSNRIGTVDVLLGLHHGQDTSNSEVLVHALRPRVAVMNNGTRKGGLPEVMRTVYTSPRFEDLWQIHFSVLSGQEYTTPGLFIANGIDDQPPAMPIAPVPLPAPGPNTPPPPAHNGPAHWIKVAAQEDGSFTVTNARNGFSKTYGVVPK